MSSAEHGLHELLASGPKQSRDITEVLANLGITQKQLRRARENLGVVVTRSGRGKDMRSFWSLPADIPATPSPSVEQPIRAHHDVVRNGHVSASPTHAYQDPPELTRANIQQFEHDRIAQRVPLFIAKGLDLLTARQVAVLLIVHRDRPGIRGGSCAECQNMRSPKACIAADAGFAEGPRAVTEVWSCGYARLSGP